MEQDLIESLLLDDRLGNLSQDSSRLLAEYLADAGGYDDLSHDVDQTMANIRQVLACTGQDIALPALRQPQRRLNTNIVIRLSAAAAGLMLAVGLYFAGYNSGSSGLMVEKPVQTANTGQVRPLANQSREAWLFSREELIKKYESSGPSGNVANVRELIKKYNLRGVIL